MRFLAESDFKTVCDNATLQVINQSDTDNMNRAENYAIEEISSYLNSRYDTVQAFSQSGDNRNAQLVMITCDVALYHLISWLPKRIGFEIRETRYKSAIAWLRDVQAGKSSPSLPMPMDGEGSEIIKPIRYGGMEKSKYDY